MSRISKILCILAILALVQISAFAQEGGGGGRRGGGFRALMEKNKGLITKCSDWMNANNWDSLATIIPKDFVDHNPDQGQKPGFDGLKETFKGYFAGFPDMKMTVKDMAVDGDKVFVRTTVEGTQKGPFMGFAASGKKYTVDMYEIFLIKDGQISERWGLFDSMGMMAQLGMLPPPPGDKK